MKKIFLLFMLLFTFNVKAVCTGSELERLKSLAEKVEFTYDYKMETTSDESGTYENPNFTIMATNLNKELRVLIINDYYQNDYREFKYNENGTSLNNFGNDETITVTIKGLVTNDCSGRTILTKKINLPFYNNFAKSEECSEYPEFKYCKEFIDDYITNSTFNSELEKYIASISEKNVPKKEKDDIINYQMVIIIGISVILLIIITLILKKIIRERKKNKL